MKRRDLIRYLEAHGCRLLREGGSHTVYLHPARKKVSTIPRHREINEDLVRRICRDLEIPEILESAQASSAPLSGNPGQLARKG